VLVPALAGGRGSAVTIRLRMESSVLDLVFVIGVLAVFTLVGVIAKGVERLGPRAAGSDARAARTGGDRA